MQDVFDQKPIKVRDLEWEEEQNLTDNNKENE